MVVDVNIQGGFKGGRRSLREVKGGAVFGIEDRVVVAGEGGQ